MVVFAVSACPGFLHFDLHDQCPDCLVVVGVPVAAVPVVLVDSGEC